MNKEIDNMRSTMGTLPSQNPKKETRIIRGCEELEVELIDYNINPYKTIVAATTATWGDDKYENKWNKLTPENRFRVVLATITGNTLLQACEGITFTFKIIGTPRHCFDQHARARIGSTFYSIGCRDNNKLDSRFILYTKLYDKFYMSKENDKLDITLESIKNMYQEIIENGKGNWQIARAVLPMCYHHPYHFSQNYLALQGQCNRRMMACEEEFIVGVHWLIREKIKEKFPLLAEYLRPLCDNVKKCVYSKSDYLSNAFGCLFKGCGRWPSGTDYATFNESCTDIEELEKQLKFHIKRPNEWINYNENDYNKLNIKDKKLFESD